MSPALSATHPRPDRSRKSSYMVSVIRAGSDKTFSVTDNRIRDMAGISALTACLKNGSDFGVMNTVDCGSARFTKASPENESGQAGNTADARRHDQDKPPCGHPARCDQGERQYDRKHADACARPDKTSIAVARPCARDTARIPSRMPGYENPSSIARNTGNKIMPIGLFTTEVRQGAVYVRVTIKTSGADM